MMIDKFGEGRIYLLNREECVSGLNGPVNVSPGDGWNLALPKLDSFF